MKDISLKNIEHRHCDIIEILGQNLENILTII